MRLAEFRALLAEFALAHPERPLAEVTVVEFAAWQEERKGPDPHEWLDLTAKALDRMPDETDAELRARHEVALGPDLIIQDEASTLTPEQAQYLRASVERWKARKAEGSPRCCLCKDTGMRPSVATGNRVSCECGALARGHVPR